MRDLFQKDKLMTNKNVFQHTGWKRLLGIICFIVFGVISTMQRGNEKDLVNILFGVLIGLVFGWISMWLMAMFIRWFNPGLKKKYKRSFARKAVSCAMVYMVPFSAMALIAVYFLHWKSAGLFVSAAISAVAVSVGAELAKLYDKPKMINNIIPSIIAAGCSMLWMFFITQITALPSLLTNFISMMK